MWEQKPGGSEAAMLHIAQGWHLSPIHNLTKIIRHTFINLHRIWIFHALALWWFQTQPHAAYTQKQNDSWVTAKYPFLLPSYCFSSHILYFFLAHSPKCPLGSVFIYLIIFWEVMGWGSQGRRGTDSEYRSDGLLMFFFYFHYTPMVFFFFFFTLFNTVMFYY